MNSEIKNKNKQSGEEVDIIALLSVLLENKKRIIKSIGIAAIIGVVIALSTPREYTVTVTLAPESSGSGSGGGLSSMASMLGMGNISLGGSVDAINVTLYPDLVNSTPFMIELSSMPVNEKGSVEQIPLSEYVLTQKLAWWSMLMRAPRLLMDLFRGSNESGQIKDSSSNIINLNREEDRMLSMLRSSVRTDVDAKTGVTSISVTMQDPMIAAVVTDSVTTKLQEFIITYRTSKAQQDYDYLEQLTREYKDEYYTAQQEYAKYLDANKNVVFQRVMLNEERLKNEMTLAYQIYSQVAAQLQLARSKVQEAKPVFAVVEPVTVPIFPSGLGRTKTVIIMMFLGFAIQSMIIIYKELQKL